jgi:DNA repair protein RecN (Recombination protein N)
VLLELRVENLLLIERTDLAFAPGLNVLTGETGAGKTVLAHALNLLLGGRSRAGIVRPGASEAYVEGVFALPDRLREERGERLPADAEEIVLARRVSVDGRTRAYVNGRSASVGDLRELGGELIAFYGQHEHRKLMVGAIQLQILDGVCGPEQALRLQACAAAAEDVRRLEAELEGLRELDGARERELDLLEYELTEIDDADPEEGEHERLLATRERARRLDALRSAAGLAAEALGADASDAVGASQLVAGAGTRLEAVAGIDPELDALCARSQALAIEADDLAAGLRAYSEGLQEEDGALEEIEERLALLERLMRKHGGTLQAVSEHVRRTRARREELLGAAVALTEIDERLQRARNGLGEHVDALRVARAAAAPRLAEAVRAQLANLAMPDATFEVELSEREPGSTGADAVELMIAPNPGVPAGPLRDIASGGELSRVMLALATVQSAGIQDTKGAGREARGAGREARGAGQDAKGAGQETRGAEQETRGAERRPKRPRASVGQQAALVFDEVDAGIGGHTARAVGERLRDLAAGRQVLCITHLPQIASLGARHFSVVKDTTADPTRASVRQLDESEVVAELVRMLGASEQDISARRHARELRKAA